MPPVDPAPAPQDPPAQNPPAQDPPPQDPPQDPPPQDPPAQDPPKDPPPQDPPAPIEYNFEMPEGIKLDETAAAGLKELAAEQKWSPEVAQKVANLGVQMIQAQKAVVDKWTADAKVDPEIGGEAFDASAALARQVVVKFGSEELMQFLDSTGLGNHPALIKTFVNAGKAIGEDKLVTGDPSPKVLSTEESFYPSMRKQS